MYRNPGFDDCMLSCPPIDDMEHKRIVQCHETACDFIFEYVTLYQSGNRYGFDFTPRSINKVDSINFHALIPAADMLEERRQLLMELLALFDGLNWIQRWSLLYRGQSPSSTLQQFGTESSCAFHRWYTKTIASGSKSSNNGPRPGSMPFCIKWALVYRHKLLYWPQELISRLLDDVITSIVYGRDDRLFQFGIQPLSTDDGFFHIL